MHACYYTTQGEFQLIPSPSRSVLNKITADLHNEDADTIGLFCPVYFQDDGNQG